MMAVFFYAIIFVKENYSFKAIVALAAAIGFGINSVHEEGQFLIINILLAISWAVSFVFCAMMADFNKKIDFLEKMKRNGKT